MRKRNRLGYLMLASALLLVSSSAGLARASRTQAPVNVGPEELLAKKVRHELVMLPYFNVFDNLEFQLEGANTVVLSGAVTRPTLRSDAENVVKRVEGIVKVVNNIEVLPLSPYDDRIRLATYRAIYGSSGLYRYALGAMPGIHIIVKNGNVTLTGVVANQSDMILAEMAARGVPGVFSITNNLRKDS
jgi:hyperosmotically inducible periplasmic protein